MPDLIKAAPVLAPGKPVTEQIERGLLEARALGFAFQRLGTIAPVTLSWRCTRLGTAIIDALHDTFGEETT